VPGVGEQRHGVREHAVHGLHYYEGEIQADAHRESPAGISRTVRAVIVVVCHCALSVRLARNSGLPIAGPAVLTLDDQDVHQVIAFGVPKVIREGVKHPLAKAFFIGGADLRMRQQLLDCVLDFRSEPLTQPQR